MRQIIICVLVENGRADKIELHSEYDTSDNCQSCCRFFARGVCSNCKYVHITWVELVAVRRENEKCFYEYSRMIWIKYRILEGILRIEWFWACASFCRMQNLQVDNTWSDSNCSTNRNTFAALQLNQSIIRSGIFDNQTRITFDLYLFELYNDRNCITAYNDNHSHMKLVPRQFY